jgi:YHS domain-containing protein
MLIRFLLLIIVGVLLARALRGVLASAIVAAKGEPPRPAGPARGVKMVRDPVCGTFLVPGNALTSSGRGATEYFCSEACRDKHARARSRGAAR